MWNDAPIFALEIDDRMQVRQCSPHLAATLGVDMPAVLAGGLHQVLDADSVERIERHMAVADLASVEATEILSFRSGHALPIETLACLRGNVQEEANVLRIYALRRQDRTESADDLANRCQLLEAFTDTSIDPMWCIEFSEPVDLSASEAEVIRQVFDNDCHWRMCNRAMMRLYELPAGVDIHHLSVRTLFPRSPANELFVRRLNQHAFCLDRVLTIDAKYSGETIYVENTVRAHIEDGFLLRMWGTARDISQQREEKDRLLYAVQQVREVLSALPDAILLVDSSRQVKAVNPACEQFLEMAATEVLGCDFSHFFALPHDDDFSRRWASGRPYRWIGEVKGRQPAAIVCDIRIAPVAPGWPDEFVISIRPVSSDCLNCGPVFLEQP